MIRPTKDDVGRKVVYRSRPDGIPEEGVLTGLAKQGGQIDERFVFARFRGPTGELTPCARLEWLAP